MNNMYGTIYYKDWNELKRNLTFDVCKKKIFPYKRYIFRGQSDSEWKLKSVFDRQYGDLELTKRKDLENFLIGEFKDLCIDWEGIEKFKTYKLEQLLTIGQHYGLATRLLDWSYSFYIATFFAYANVIDNMDNVAIWIIDSKHDIWQGEHGVSIIKEKVEENIRQRYQYGVFTLNKSTEKTIDDYVMACSKSYNIDGALYKVILPSKEKNIVLSDLDMMGINYFNLFRGIEGCAMTSMLKATLK